MSKFHYVSFLTDCATGTHHYVGYTSLHFASREYFTKAYLRPLTAAGLVVRRDPDHPNSPRQKYALTKAGAERIRRVALL